MNCALNETQEKSILKLLGQILSKSDMKSPEQIIRDVYNNTYQAFVSKGLNDKAREFGIAAAEYAASQLHVVSKMYGSSEMREAFAALSGNENAFSKENLERLGKVDEIKKLLGLRDKELKRVKSEVKKEEVQSILDKIKDSFPQSTEKKVYSDESGNLKWNFSILKDKEGNDVRVPEVTVFLKNKLPMVKSQADNLSTRAGNMVDYVVRQFISSNKDFPKFLQDMLANEAFLDMFAAYSENRPIPDISYTEPVFLKFATDFLKDISYALNYIQEEYKGYYLTDLTSLLDKSNLSTEDKNRFFIYSAEIGLKGEIDLLAISPDGTFRVIDIKTSSMELDNQKLDRYAKQVSLYDLIIQKATGLKSAGESDIVNIKLSIDNPSLILNTKGAGMYKLGVIDFKKIAQKNLSDKALIEDVKAFRESMDKLYVKEFKVESTTNIKLPGLPNMVRTGPLGIVKKGPRKLNSILNAEPLSTYEDLLRGKSWLHTAFPELEDKHVVISRITNSGLGGEFFLDNIKLYELSNKGVAFHEGWHRFSQLYLTKSEKEKMYNQVRSSNINFTTRDGRKVNSKKASYLDIEEFLAEEFKNFALDRDNYSFPKEEKSDSFITNLFRKLMKYLTAISNFFSGNGEFAFEEIFSNLHTGTFNRTNFNTNNSMWSSLNSVYTNSVKGSGEVLDNNTFFQLRDFVDFKLNEHLTNNSKTITNMLSKEGITEIRDFVRDIFLNNEPEKGELGVKPLLEERIKESKADLETSKDEQVKATLEMQIKEYNYFLDAVNKVGQKEGGKLINLPDFMRAYFKSSEFETLGSFIGKNEEKIDSLLENIFEDEEEKGSELDDSVNTPDVFEFNRDANIRPETVARAELKDFFVGVQRIYIEGTEEDYRYNSIGLPETLSKKEAFYKTLEILQGSHTLENIKAALRSPTNNFKFPELRDISYKLIGKDDAGNNVGIISKYEELSDEINSGLLEGEELSNKRDQQAKLHSFIMHFTHIMSMRKLDYDNFVCKLNYPALSSDENQKKSITPLATRPSLELVINNIVGEFTKGFKLNSQEDFNRTTGKHLNIYQLMHDIFTSVNPTDKFGSKLQNSRFLYDPMLNQFFFNPVYATMLSDNSDPDDATIKAFLHYLGINLSDRIFTDTRPGGDFEQIKKSYSKLRASLQAMNAKSTEYMIAMIGNSNLVKKLEVWKSYSDAVARTSESDEARKGLEQGLIKAQLDLRPYLLNVFPTDPISTMLFDGQDLKLRYNPRNRVFAVNRPTFEDIARVQKKYHGNFSSGSMLVVDDLQFAYFLPNQLTLIESIINEHIHHIDDFDKYPGLNHLNPRINPGVMNSGIMRKLFDPNTGLKVPGARLGLSDMAQVTLITPEGSIEAKTMSELKEDEKILYDFLALVTNGSSEIRRLETSNTAYRLSLKYGNDFSKLVSVSSSFNNQSFLNQIHSYVQHAAHKYKYYRVKANRELDARHDEKVGKETISRMDTVGIFDEMIPESIGSLKKVIEDYSGDLNQLFKHIEKENPKLLEAINREVVSYFEGVTIKNKDSYKNVMKEKLSSKSKASLRALHDLSRGVYVDNNGIPADSLLRDAIANDFFMAMEDSIFFFGDYTYYKDPSKRRKIIGNNGSVDMTDAILERGKQAIHKYSIEKMYQDLKGISTEKDHKLVKKFVIADLEKDSAILDESNGISPMMQDLLDIQKQRYGNKKSDADILADLKESKKQTIKAFTGMQLADAGAYISISSYRTMMQREMRWTKEHEQEYNRQMLILKDKLGEELTDEERKIVNSKALGKLNVAKFALTGPVFSKEGMPFKPTFDKMGLRILLPEYDWDKTTRPLLEYMYGNNIDYIVYNTGSKGYTPVLSSAMTEDGLFSNFDPTNVAVTEHAGQFFKNQQNTSGAKRKSTFSSQLRGIFFEIMLIIDKNTADNNVNSEKLVKNLRDKYANFVRTLTDYIQVHSSETLSEMGVDNKGKIKDLPTFINYMRERLIRAGTVDPDQLDLLNVKHDGTLVNYLESLPFQKEVGNMLAGIIDDSFRKIKLNGSKFYQSPELGTTKYQIDKKASEGSTLELRWHHLERDDKGNITRTAECEVKINFSDQWEPLFNLQHPDGDPIGVKGTSRIAKIRRLNEALKDPQWVKFNRDSITFIGVRIPLQDINFSSHMIIKEFLPESMGDIIIAPPEFYMQTGSDNDIDSVTASFKYLDKRTGKTVTKPPVLYQDILDEVIESIEALSKKNLTKTSIGTNRQMNVRIDDLKKKFEDANVYYSKGKSLSDMEDDFSLISAEGLNTFLGLVSTKSTMFKILREGTHPELMDELQEIVSDLNSSKRAKIEDEDAIKLKKSIDNRKAFKEGLTNSMISSIEQFMQLPENYDFLTETDSIQKIQNMAADMLTLNGKPTAPSDLGKSLTPLKNISYVQNLVNHKNNAEIRSILGSIVKFRRLLTTHAQIKTHLNKQYTAGNAESLSALYDKINNVYIPSETQKDHIKKVGKVYKRTIYTPLLYKKNTAEGIDISIFDENGGRITKNLSMITSSLLDLFKNQDIFPSLNISWLNVKPLVFLTAQGVPLERAVLFLNNPIVQEVQRSLNSLGSDAQDRHAIVHAAQDLFGSDLFPIAATSKEASKEGMFQVLATRGQRTVPNPMLRRHGKQSQQYLESQNKIPKLTEEELRGFNIAYSNYLNETKIVDGKEVSARQSYDNNLKSFLNKNPALKEQGKYIMAYYSTVVEDGDLFYKFFVKPINRDAVKHNTRSSISNAETIKKARMASKMTNDDFENKMQFHTTQSPFYNDDIVKNLLSSLTPKMLENPTLRIAYVGMVEKLTSKIYGPEEKALAEARILSDFIELVYKNFYIVKDRAGRGNTLYEFFQFDISPLLRPMFMGSKEFEKFLNKANTTDRGQTINISADATIEAFHNDRVFANQIEMFRLKYPELNTISLIDKLLVAKKPAVVPGKTSNFEMKDVLNMLDQNFIHMNMPSNVDDRMALEAQIRDDWDKLLKFNISSFPFLKLQAEKAGRSGVYSDPDNIREISEFAHRLALYALTQSTHLTQTGGAFSNMVPYHIIKKVVESSIDNFNEFLSTNSKDINNVVMNMIGNEARGFVKFFRDMNGDLGWQTKDGEPSPVVRMSEDDQDANIDYDPEYEPDTEPDVDPERAAPVDKGYYRSYKKADTGKLYSKMGDQYIVDHKYRNLMKGLTESYNDFTINPFGKADEDPLNCIII